MIREMGPEEFCLLKDFLYDAIFVPEGDMCFVADADGEERIQEAGNRDCSCA